MVQSNDFRRQWIEVGDAAMAAVQRVGGSGWYILGNEVKQFETALATYWGINYAVGVANGMDAIEIGLRALGLEAGGKVLTTPVSAFPTTLAILRAGGVPVFADVDDNGNIDLEGCRAVLRRDNSIRFFVPVHLYGIPLDLIRLQELKDEFDLAIVEDCAQSIGAAYADLPVGTVGQVTATSFYPTKNLGAFGDGGALLTDDNDLAIRAASLRNYGQSSLYVHDLAGLNSRLDELHAAVLRDALLPKLHRWTEARRGIAREYLSRIQNPAIARPTPPEGAKPVWHLFPVFIAADWRDAFRAFLREAGIATGIHYPRVIPMQEALLRSFNATTPAVVPKAERITATEVSLPIHPFLSSAEVNHVIDTCNEWRP